MFAFELRLPHALIYQHKSTYDYVLFDLPFQKKNSKVMIWDGLLHKHYHLSRLLDWYQVELVLYLQEDQWPVSEGPIDVVLVEGWCMGAVALDDIRESLAELKHYRETFLKLPS